MQLKLAAASGNHWLDSGKLYPLNRHIFVNIGCMLDFSFVAYVEVGFLKWYLILVPRHQTDTTNLNAVVPWTQLGIKSSSMGWKDGTRPG